MLQIYRAIWSPSVRMTLFKTKIGCNSLFFSFSIVDFTGISCSCCFFNKNTQKAFMASWEFFQQNDNGFWRSKTYKLVDRKCLQIYV